MTKEELEQENKRLITVLANKIDDITQMKAVHAALLNGRDEDISVLQEENIELMKRLRDAREDDCCDCADYAIENAEKVNKSFEVALLTKWFAL